MIKLLLFFLCVFYGCFGNLNAQELTGKYHQMLPTISQLNERRAKEGNSYYFMEMSNFINANNQMFLNTRDKQYLWLNANLVKHIYTSGQNNTSEKEKGALKWVARFNNNKTHKDANLSGQEVPLYESYLMRYIAQYALLNTVDEDALQLVQNTFDKWYYRGLRNNKNLSNLIRSRTHMGALWASTAMYLYKLTDESKYLDFVNRYNDLLRNNLKEQMVYGEVCYVWNSTYDVNPITNKPSNLRPVIQDVAHGNHVVQYIIDSYKNGIGGWKNEDLQKLSNTLKLIVWDPQKQRFNENVDGSNGGEGEGQAWKQSDGWMKLIEIDNDLKPIYIKYYEKNKDQIDKNFLNLQTYSVLAGYIG